MRLRAMLEELIISGSDDWVDVCEVAWIAKSLGNATQADENRELSIKLIRELLERNLMEIGDVTVSGFVGWNLPLNQAMERLAELWQALPGVPSLGDVCWLNLTEGGKAEAAKVANRRLAE